MSSTQNPPVSVRVSATECEMLAAAAQQVRTSLSDFVRRKALEAVEIELLSHPVVTIPAAIWDRFEAWAHAPAKPIPALRDLAATKPAWLD